MKENKDKKLSSDYNYRTWHLADFKSGRPNFTKAVNVDSKLARSLPNQILPYIILRNQISPQSSSAIR